MAVARKALVSAAIFLLISSVFASTPSSVTINPPTDDSVGVKQSFSYFGGPFAGATGFTNYSLPTCTQAVVPPGVCDSFTVHVNLPGNYYDNHHSKLTVTLTWQPDIAGNDPSLNDLDIYIVDVNGNDLGHGADTNPAAAGGTGQAKEVAFTGDTPAGDYRIIVINSVSATPVPRFDVSATFELTPPPVIPPATAQIFTHYQPPVNADGSRLGKSAGEPSIGVNWKTGNVMYEAGVQTLRIRFDDAKKPATATWENVGALITSQETLDPILFTDHRTGRTFVSQLYLACSLLAFTDDDGANWFQNPLGCGVGTAFDHQTVGGGPFAPGASSADPAYKNSVIYCAHDDVTGACATSKDGGVTFGPASFVWNITECGTIHGHVRVGPDGYQYLPNHNCNGGQQALGISADNGQTWTIHPIPGSSSGNFDPWVDIGPNNTIYFGYTDGNGHAYVTTSRDHGNTWSTPFDVGATQGVQNSEFASVVVGDDDRAAMAFLGTTTGGNDQASTFSGAWNLYVAFTYDGGKTWTTYNTTPGDPVQRGCIWAGGGSNPCRNLLDFMGITVDKLGRVLVGYADGCIDDPQNAANHCVSNPPSDVSATVRTKIASIARQTSGVGLLKQYDGVLSTAPGTPVLSGLADNTVNHLNWTVPADGGTPITGYRLYRGNSSGGEALLASVSASTTSYNDSGLDNGTTYFYRVAAVNAVGTSAASNEVGLTPALKAAPTAPRKLKAIGSKNGVNLTWWQPTSSGTAPITAYRVYRGLAPGMENFVAEAGNKTQFVDATAQSNVTYYYVVTAVNAVGESPRSNEDSASRK